MSLDPAPGDSDLRQLSTQWTRILDMVDADPSVSGPALREVLETYYRPILRFFQRAKGLPEERALDLTHTCLARLRDAVRDRLRDRTSFRGFLIKYVLQGAWRDHLRDAPPPPLADGQEPAALDAELERSVNEEFVRFYREESLRRTREALVAAGRELEWRVLEARALGDGPEPSFEEVGARLGVSLAPSTLRGYLMRARDEWKEQLRRLVLLGARDPGDELRLLGLPADFLERSAGRRG